MNDARSYIPPVELGAVMRALAAGRVVRSNHPKFAVDDHVVGAFGVQEFSVSDVLFRYAIVCGGRTTLVRAAIGAALAAASALPVAPWQPRSGNEARIRRDQVPPGATGTTLGLTVLASGPGALADYQLALDEWRLLTAAALAGAGIRLISGEKSPW